MNNSTKLGVFFLALLALSIHATAFGSEKYVIGQWPGGLGIAITAVLCHLSYCDDTNKIPVVYWDNKYYYNHGGFNGSHNVWEYYFEPVSALTYDPRDTINHFFDPKYSHFSYHQAHQSQPMRDHAHRLISKYIKIKPVVQAKIDQFYNAHMLNKKTIGIHIRGTDKFTEERPVSPQAIVAEALKHADANTQFLLATDDQHLLVGMLNLLQGYPVIYYDCYRSSNGMPLFNYKRSQPSYGQIGEDVIVEMSLLAKCDVFIHTLSNVSAIVLYLNPQLKNFLVVGQ